MIRAGVDNSKVVESVDIILRELDKIKKEGISTGEFTRGKDYLLGQLLLGLEDTMEHMLWIGDAVLSKGKTKTVSKIVSEFEKIKKNDIKRVANEVLAISRYNLAIVGPVSDDAQSKLKGLIF
jgi:predicted Zn-dependent peptidase